MIDALLARDLGCAPHVVARLAARLAADATAVVEVAERLTPEQRHGLRALPEPLPLVPAIATRFDRMTFAERDRTFLLALSVRLGDGLDVLLDIDGRTAAQIAAGPVGEFIWMSAGRVRFRDPRLAVWLQAEATSTATGAVHSMLSAACARHGDRVGADWHRARGSLVGAPEAAVELTTLARELAEDGQPDRSLQLAREAAKHASGDMRDEARLVAGVAAAGAGYAADAAAWLGSLFPHAAERVRLRGLGGLLVAQSFLQGAVPEVDPTVFIPGTDAPEDWWSWTRASGMAAVLCAERGDRRAMRVWLDAVRQGTAIVGAQEELRDPVVGLSWLILGEHDLDESSGTGPISGTLLGALRAACNGDVDRGLRLLSTEQFAMGARPDVLVRGNEHSPLVRAYLAVAEVLLLVWRGDIGAARELLLRAACELPIAMPFAGLGVVLARRLDLAVLGELGPFSRALTAALPHGAALDVLVDRGIQSFLAGSFDAAASSVRLWLDRGAPHTRMAVPGLDEVALMAGAGAGISWAIQPPEIALAHDLRVRIATSSEGRWHAERERVHATARTLRSPFARARVETMLGVQHAIRDDHVPARVHFQYAERLFEAAGATAWARAARDRLDRLEATASTVIPAVEPLGNCRSAWAQQLTARELDVAMRAVHGALNRDIAADLTVSVRTVEVHLGRVFAKLDVRNRVELAVLAHRTERHL